MKSLPVLTVAATLLLAAAFETTSLAQDAQPAAAAQSPAPPPPSSSAASATLAKARERLLSYRSVRAKIRERVVIGDRQFTAEGQYIQGADLKLCLEYDVKLGSSEGAPFEGSLLQKCDGQVLWTRYLVNEGLDPKSKPTPRITRRDVQLILNTVAKSGNVPQNLLVSELGLGGFPALLAALEMNMKFDRQEPAEDGKLLMISGTWKDEFLGRLPKLPEKPDRLADYIPDAVRVYLDHENLFPRRILYLKKHLTRNQMLPMVSVDLVEVTLNGPVKEEDFQYIPPEGVSPVNVTEDYLRRLIPQQPAPQAAAGQPPQAGAPTPPGGAPPQAPAGAASPAGAGSP